MSTAAFDPIGSPSGEREEAVSSRHDVGSEVFELSLPATTRIVAIAALWAASIVIMPVIWPSEANTFETMAKALPFGFWWIPFAFGLLLGPVAVYAIVHYQPSKPERLVHSFVAERIFRFLWLASLAILTLQIMISLGRLVAEHGGRFQSGVASVQLGYAVTFVLVVLVVPLLLDIAKAVRLLVRIGRIFASRWEIEQQFSSPEEADSCDVLVLSDLHWVAEGQQTLEKCPPGEPVYEFAGQTIAKSKPNALILCGDVTDTGEPEAWAAAREFFQRYEIPIYAAPGNHDIHFRRIVSGGGAGDPELDAYRGSPHWRFIKSLFAIEQPPVEDVDSSYTAADVMTSIRALCSDPKPDAEQFPLCWDHEELRIRVIALDSNRRGTTSPITNAFGLVGKDQLAAAEKLAKPRPTGYGLILVMHHHIIPPTHGWERLLLTCLDVNEVLEFAMRHRVTAILHGHTHMPYVYHHVKGDHSLWIVSCGSALFPAGGLYAAKVGGASCMGLKLADGQVQKVVLFRSKHSASGDTGQPVS